MQERGPHPSGIDERPDFALIVERGIDRSFRIRIGDVSEDPLGAAELIEVIVNQRDARRYIPSDTDSRGKTIATVKRCK